MKLGSFIIALMAFAAVGLVLFSFVADLYAPDNLDVTFDEDTQAKFDALDANLKKTKSDTDDFSGELQSYAPGGANASITSPSLTTSDLLVGSLKAIVRMPSVLGIFGNIIISISAALGISSVITGFIIGAVIISIIIIIISAVLQKNLES
jgi:hypothetical protein